MARGPGEPTGTPDIARPLKLESKNPSKQSLVREQRRDPWPSSSRRALGVEAVFVLDFAIVFVWGMELASEASASVSVSFPVIRAREVSERRNSHSLINRNRHGCLGRAIQNQNTTTNNSLWRQDPGPWVEVVLFR